MLRCYLIEHADMNGEGTSALTDLLKDNLVGSPHYFSDGASFLKACATVDAQLANCPEDVHVVVICTHGDEGTGKLDMGIGNSPLAPIHKLFPSRPEKLLVYMAVCWGAYAGVMKMFQHGKAPFPVVVGAIVDARSDEGDLLQDEVVHMVESGKIDEDAIEAAVSRFTSNPALDYGQHAARIARSNGELIPKQGSAGISWGLLRDADDAPVEGPFEVVAVDSKRNVATVQHDGKQWRIMAGRLRVANSGIEPKAGQRFRFKAKLCPGSDVLQIVGEAALVT